MDDFKKELATLYILKDLGLTMMNEEDLNESQVISTDNYFETYTKYMNKFQNDFNKSNHKDEFTAIGKYMKKINDNILKATQEEVANSIIILRMIYDEYDEKCDDDQRTINQELLIKQYHLF